MRRPLQESDFTFSEACHEVQLARVCRDIGYRLWWATAQRTTPEAQTPAEVALKAGATKTSTDPAVNPNAAVMAEFKSRVEKYAGLHKELAKGSAAQKEDSNAAQVNAQKTALVAKIQAARATAKHGDIFSPEMRPIFRRLLAPELKGEDGRDAKAILRDDAPASGTVPFRVNAKYPETQRNCGMVNCASPH